MRIPCKTRAKKRARKSNPLRAAKLVAKREVPAVKVFRSGREVCSNTPEGQAEYLKRIEQMCERQGGLCGCGCGRVIVAGDARNDIFRQYSLATFDHENGRGSGGSRRDDRIVLPDGTLQNRALTFWCNSAKGSKRGYETDMRRGGEVEA